jgi:hypothetical protein
MKYLILLVLLVAMIYPQSVDAAKVCEVPSDKLDAYNQCQQVLSGAECDKTYRTSCRELSAVEVESVFGKIQTPSQISGIPLGTAGINHLIRLGINLLFIVGAISTLFFVIWGAIDYISAGTRKEGAAEARKKITYALMGLVLLGLSFFVVRLVGNIVGLGELFQF